MADNIDIKIQGIPELQAKLLAMQQDIAARAISTSVYTACKIFEDEIKTSILTIPLIDTYSLYKSIIRKRVIYENSNTVVVITGVSKDFVGPTVNGKPRIPKRYAPIWEHRLGFVAEVADKKTETVRKKVISDLKARINKYTKST